MLMTNKLGRFHLPFHHSHSHSLSSSVSSSSSSSTRHMEEHSDTPTTNQTNWNLFDWGAADCLPLDDMGFSTAVPSDSEETTRMAFADESEPTCYAARLNTSESSPSPPSTWLYDPSAQSSSSSSRAQQAAVSALDSSASLGEFGSHFGQGQQNEIVNEIIAASKLRSGKNFRNTGDPFSQRSEMMYGSVPINNRIIDSVYTTARPASMLIDSPMSSSSSTAAGPTPSARWKPSKSQSRLLSALKATAGNSPSTSDGVGSDLEQRRIDRRRERNRLAAKRSRQKRVSYICELEQTIMRLQEENTKLQSRIDSMAHDILFMKRAQSFQQDSDDQDRGGNQGEQQLDDPFGDISTTASDPDPFYGFSQL